MNYNYCALTIYIDQQVIQVKVVSVDTARMFLVYLYKENPADNIYLATN